MPTISEIYNRYPITRGLRQHQLRVAAVAATLVDGFDRRLDRDGVIRACLVHDMGNLIKFDLNSLPELLEPQGRDYWERQKAAMVTKYGTDEHQATLDILHELEVSDKIVGYIKLIGFKNTVMAVESPSFEGKICHYADHRTTPQGVASLRERLDDGKKRYSGRTDLPALPRERWKVLHDASFELERQIFEHMKFPPEHVTEALVEPLLAQLANTEF